MKFVWLKITILRRHWNCIIIIIWMIREYLRCYYVINFCYLIVWNIILRNVRKLFYWWAIYHLCIFDIFKCNISRFNVFFPLFPQSFHMESTRCQQILHWIVALWRRRVVPNFAVQLPIPTTVRIWNDLQRKEFI